MIVETEIASEQKAFWTDSKKKIKFSENALIGELYTSSCEISKDVK